MAGFGFSAGLIDLLLSTKNPLACNWYMLIIQGLVFFVLYFVIFNFAIQKFNLKTPGREDDDEAEVEITVSGDASYAEKALMLLPLLGGIENIVDIDNCATRLRLEVKDNTIIQAAEIKKIFPGVLTPGKTSVQVIVGPKVQFLADEFKKVAKK